MTRFPWLLISSSPSSPPVTLASKHCNSKLETGDSLSFCTWNFGGLARVTVACLLDISNKMHHSQFSRGLAFVLLFSLGLCKLLKRTWPCDELDNRENCHRDFVYVSFSGVIQIKSSTSSIVWIRLWIHLMNRPPMFHDTRIIFLMLTCAGMKN